MTPSMFDFGLVRARPMPAGSLPGSMWSWSLLFRGDPRIWHIVRRSGRLKVWA